MKQYQNLIFLCLVNIVTSTGVLGCRHNVELQKEGYAVSTVPTKELPDPSVLNRDFFAKHALGISPETFMKRWKNSLSSPLVFFRSHVRAYYAITKGIALPNPKTGLCYGDAHVANFGFIEGKDGQARLLYNDLDDSGICPVLLDALRYFTSVRFLDDEDEVKKLISLYISIVNGKEDAVGIKSRFEPNFKKMRKEVLGKYVDGGRIRRQPGVFDDVSPQLAAETSRLVEETLASEGEQGKALDVSLASGHGGGSYGLVRYWALSGGATQDITEVKECSEPATSIGNWGQVPGNRLETLKKNFWGGPEAARIYREREFQGKIFVIRSRVKQSLDPEEFSGKDRSTIYQAQVSLLAELHRKTLGSLSDADSEIVAEWLVSSSKKISKLYKQVHEAAR